jgi:hypothetical protein
VTSLSSTRGNEGGSPPSESAAPGSSPATTSRSPSLTR